MRICNKINKTWLAGEWKKWVTFLSLKSYQSFNFMVCVLYATSVTVNREVSGHNGHRRKRPNHKKATSRNIQAYFFTFWCQTFFDWMWFSFNCQEDMLNQLLVLTPPPTHIPKPRISWFMEVVDNVSFCIRGQIIDTCVIHMSFDSNEILTYTFIFKKMFHCHHKISYSYTFCRQTVLISIVDFSLDVTTGKQISVAWCNTAVTPLR